MKKIFCVFALLLFSMIITSCGVKEEVETKTADGLLQAFKDGGMSVVDEITYTAETDPNEKLGRPGEYIAKTNFNDSNFSTDSSKPSISIEVFAKKSEMEKRMNYIKDISDNADMNALKYYIYGKDTFLFRIPYDATPEQAAAYEKIFNEYLK